VRTPPQNFDLLQAFKFIWNNMFAYDAKFRASNNFKAKVEICTTNVYRIIRLTIADSDIIDASSPHAD
jgi:hypothetical protein